MLQYIFLLTGSIDVLYLQFCLIARDLEIVFLGGFGGGLRKDLVTKLNSQHSHRYRTLGVSRYFDIKKNLRVCNLFRGIYQFARPAPGRQYGHCLPVVQQRYSCHRRHSRTPGTDTFYAWGGNVNLYHYLVIIN